jgi:tetratricopeptide (TPR) repeat protein
LVWILKKQGRGEEAKPIVDFLLSQRPNSASFYHFAGNIAADMGNAGQAVEHFNAALALDPVSQQNRRALAHGLNSRSILYRWYIRHQEYIVREKRGLLMMLFLGCNGVWLIGGIAMGINGLDLFSFRDWSGICIMLFVFGATMLGIPNFANLFLLFDKRAWKTLHLRQKLNAFSIAIFYSLGWLLEICLGSWISALLFLLLPAHFLWLILSAKRA